MKARAIESPPLKLLTLLRQIGLIAWRYSPMRRAMRQEMR